MSNDFRKRYRYIIFFNSIIAISTLIIAASGILFGAGDGQVGDRIIGLGYFKPYTMDSNILAGISAALLVFYCRKSLNQNRETVPSWLCTLYFMSTTGLSLTLLIAAGFLAPMKLAEGRSYSVMFQGDMFFFHLINPLLAILTFTCLLKTRRFRKAECIKGAVSTILYSFVYFFMVVVVGCWKDFYNFTLGGNYSLVPLIFLVVYLLVLLLTALLIYFHNRGLPKSEQAS